MCAEETIGAAVMPPAGKTKMEVILKLQGLLGVHPMIVDCPNIMSISLGNPGMAASALCLHISLLHRLRFALPFFQGLS